MSGIQNTDKTNILFKKFQGYANTDNSVLNEFQENARPYSSLNRLYSKDIPSTAPTSLSDTTITKGYKKSVSAATESISYTRSVPTDSNQSYIVKYSNVPLYGFSGQTDRAFYYNDLSGTDNLLKYAIPANYDANGSYNYTVYLNNGTTVVSKDNYSFDTDAGLITFYNYPSVSQSSPPKVTFWRYEGTLGIPNWSTIKATETVDVSGNRITGLANPEGDTDAVSKAYLVSQIGSVASSVTPSSWSTYPATTSVDISGNRIIRLAEPIDASGAATKNYVDSNFNTLSTTVSGLSTTVSASNVSNWATFKAVQQVDMSNNKIINLAAPTANTDAVTKAYVDGSLNTFIINPTSIKIGSNAGLVAQGQQTIAIGLNAGSNTQGSQSVAIGNSAGSNRQGTFSVAIGDTAGQTSQGNYAVALGENAGQISQVSNAIAIGFNAGSNIQQASAVAIGNSAGQNNQKSNSIAIGVNAGSNTQNERSIAIGFNAGSNNQGIGSIAIGQDVGSIAQSINSVAIGRNAGNTSQGSNAVAMGSNAGSNNQGTGSIAIGSNAGANTQGSNSIAIGAFAGQTSQSANTIVLNATGNPLSANTGLSGTYIAPIRDVSNILTNVPLFYDTNSREVVQGPSWSRIQAVSDISMNGSRIRQLADPIDASGAATKNYVDSSFNTLSTTVSTLSGTVTSNKTAIDSSFNTLSTTVSTLSGTVTSNKTAIDSSFNTLSTTVSTLSGTVSSNKAAIDSSFNTLSTTVSTLSGTVTSNKTAIDSSFNTLIINPTSIKIGSNAGVVSQSTGYAIAIGSNAGSNAQGYSTIALGIHAGSNNQGNTGIAIGSNAGSTSQSIHSISLGNAAGNKSQGQYSIAIGTAAGSNTQGANAIAIGQNAGQTSQPANSIVLNASSVALNGSSQGFYVRPIRDVSNVVSNIPLYYDTLSNEIVRGPNWSQITATSSVNMNNNIITNLPIPNELTDAATKQYVDSAMATNGTSSWATFAATSNVNMANYRITAMAEPQDASGAATRNYVDSKFTTGSVRIGTNAGTIPQDEFVVAIGNQAGSNAQSGSAVAIGDQAAITSQGSNSIAIGKLTGSTNQGSHAVAIGFDAANANQGFNSIAIGERAGRTSQDISGIAIGAFAGCNAQRTLAIAIGTSAGFNSQQSNAIALGNRAGSNRQGIFSVAIGDTAGNTSQGNYSVALGENAGQISQNSNSVAIGYNAGLNMQGFNTIAIGQNAGSNSQAAAGIAIGRNTGTVSQQIHAVALGNEAGSNTQGQYSIAIGTDAGRTSQGSNSVAIGLSAGSTAQGSNAIAIGKNAGTTSQSANSIVLNASSTVIINGSSQGFYVNPVRDVSNVLSNIPLYYNALSNEIVRGPNWSQITATSNVNMNNNRITNLPTPSVNTDAATKGYVDSAVVTSGTSSWATFAATSNVNMANYRITAMAEPTDASGAATKNYVDLRNTILSTAIDSSFNTLSTTFSTLSGTVTSNKTAVDSSLNTIINTTIPTAVSGWANYQAVKDVSMNGFRIRQLQEPVDASGAATKNYVDGSLNTLIITPTTIKIGSNAGSNAQRTLSIAIGNNAGQTSQSMLGDSAIAIGNAAGRLNQGTAAIAIGALAGSNSQGSNAIAIGAFAGQTSQSSNSIIINATSSQLNTSSQGFYVAPVRSNTTYDTSNVPVYYNTASKEFTYNQAWNTLREPTNMTTPKLEVTSANITQGTDTYDSSIYKLDNWLYKYLLAPAPQIDASTNKIISSTELIMFWTLPTQIQASFTTRKLPAIDRLKADITGTGFSAITDAVNITTNLPDQANPITVLVISKNSGVSGYYQRNINGTIYNAYVYYNTSLSGATGTLYVNISYQNAQGTTDVTQVSLSAFTAAYPPSIIRFLTGNSSTNSSITYSWTQPQYVLNDPTTPLALGATGAPAFGDGTLANAYLFTYSVQSTSKYGITPATPAIDNITYSAPNQSTTKSGLVASTTYQITGSARNSLTSTYGPTASITYTTAAPTIPTTLLIANAGTANGSTTFNNNLIGTHYTRTVDGSIAVNIRSTASATTITQPIFYSATGSMTGSSVQLTVHNTNTVGATTSALMKLAWDGSNFFTVNGWNSNLTASSNVAITGTITSSTAATLASTIADYYSGDPVNNGLVLRVNVPITLSWSGQAAGTTSYSKTLTHTIGNPSVNTTSTYTLTYFVDSLPTITLASITSTPTFTISHSSKQICGITIYGIAATDNIVMSNIQITNPGNFFYYTDRIFKVTTGAPLNTSATFNPTLALTGAQITNPQTFNTQNLSTTFISQSPNSSRYTKGISYTITPYNINGNGTNYTASSFNIVLDEATANRVFVSSEQDPTTNSTTGREGMRFANPANITGTAVTLSTFNNAAALPSGELLFANGAYRYKTTGEPYLVSYTTFLNNSTLNYSSIASEVSTTFRYTTFSWTIPKTSSSQISSLAFIIKNFYNANSTITGIDTTSGSLNVNGLTMHYKFQEYNSSTPVDITDSNAKTTVWIDALTANAIGNSSDFATYYKNSSNAGSGGFIGGSSTINSTNNATNDQRIAVNEWSFVPSQIAYTSVKIYLRIGIQASRTDVNFTDVYCSYT